jgi:protein-disulfide isomerase
MESSKTTTEVSRGTAILGMLITFVGGYFVGSITGSRPGGVDTSEAAAVKRTFVPVGLSPVDGPAEALVTVVEVADFQCGYCAKSVGLKKAIMATFRGKVRWVFKHYPLPMHRQARKAAEASMAAHAQGKFWPYHDLLFQNRSDLSKPVLDRLAQRLVLNMDKFREQLQGGAFEKVVQADMDLANKLGVNGTPTFFINGRKHVGSIKVPAMERLVSQELAYARDLLKRGVSPANLYRVISSGKKADTAKTEPTARGAAVAPRVKIARAPATEGTIYKIDPGEESPVWGDPRAPVTMILFADFQCPHSARLHRELKQIQQQFGPGRLRVVFKNFPMASHKQARLAAEASLAAQAQGKFWPYYDLLFQSQGDLSRRLMVDLARRLGLDLDRFVRELDAHTWAPRVEADIDLAVRFGAVGTPTLYVNGRYYNGFRTAEQLRELMVGELRRAETALQNGVDRSVLYEHLIGSGLDRVKG